MIYDPDPIQNAITTEAMKLVGNKTLTVRERRANDIPDAAAETPSATPWVVVDAATDGVCYFGPAAYGGETREAALAEARRLAGKWDWEVTP